MTETLWEHLKEELEAQLVEKIISRRLHELGMEEHSRTYALDVQDNISIRVEASSSKKNSQMCFKINPSEESVEDFLLAAHVA